MAVLMIFLAIGEVKGAAPLNWGNTDTIPLLKRAIPNDLVYKGSERGGVSTIVSSVSQLSKANISFGLLKLSGASKTFSMVAGTKGQEITLVKEDYDPRTLKLDFSIDSPQVAHSGFTSVTWPTQPGSFVTLLWLDDTNGWIIIGASPNMTISY